VVLTIVSQFRGVINDEIRLILKWCEISIEFAILDMNWFRCLQPLPFLVAIKVSLFIDPSFELPYEWSNHVKFVVVGVIGFPIGLTTTR
jgi:hypothetical protein